MNETDAIIFKKYLRHETNCYNLKEKYPNGIFDRKFYKNPAVLEGKILIEVKV